MDNYIFEVNEQELDEFLAQSDDRSNIDEEKIEEQLLKHEIEEALESSRKALIHNLMELNDEYLMHYGVGADDNPPGRGSGRYPKGSGENPNQHERLTLAKQVKGLKDQGLSAKEIAEGLGFKSTTELRAHISIEKDRRQALLSVEVPRLAAAGYSRKEIQERFGISDGSVRNYLNADRKLQTDKTKTVADTLKKELESKKYIDVGAGVNYECGVSETRFKTAVAMCKAEGYKTYYIKVEQMGNPGKFTTVKVLGTPDSEWSEVVKDPSLIRSVSSYFQDDGKSVLGLERPRSISSERIKIRYGDEKGPDGYTGVDRDGIIQLRRGVDEISLGRSNYSQVRIAVDDSHYLKGMAIYADDDLFPPGCDIIYNTNKTMGTDKYKVFKEMKLNKITGEVNWDNPFGASIKDGIKDPSAAGQSYYTDPVTGEKKLRVINKVNDQGDYGEWKKKISPQMYTKQPPELVAKQLRLTLEDRKAEYEDIMSIDIPTVRKHFLESFAEDCDAAASHLKAKAFPGQSTNVLIAIPSLGEDECYSPNYPDGERLAFVRYPHAGPQEIVVARNNLHNAEGIKTLGKNAPDAIGLHPSQYPKLSGADSDGDTAVIIPLSKTNVKALPMFQGMQGFDSKQYKFADPNAEGIKHQTMQNEMGKVTNLIADMGVFNAKDEEMVRAIKHSQVVIDAEKHHLDWKKSEQDFKIQELKDKYQGGGGASTLITRAKSELRVDQRKPGTYTDPITGKTTRGVNPNTGELIWEKTGESYEKNGKTIYRQEKITKMEGTSDAMTLLSSQSNPHPNEVLCGQYANALKAMANEARREAVNTPRLQRDPAAAKKYATQVAELNEALTVALKNAPRERQAQIMSHAVYDAQIEANPDIANDKAYCKRLAGQALTQARNNNGARKQRIVPNEQQIEAIRNNAISDTMLKRILDNSEDDVIRKAFTPQTSKGISSSMESLAKSMAANGYSNADIAERLGVSVSSVSRIVNG